MDATAVDADLVARAQGGDVEAYASLIAHNQSVAVGLAALILGDSSDAEDVAQEAFIKAYYALDRFRPGASFRAWLVRIVANEARNFKAAAQRRTGLRSRLAEEVWAPVQAASAEEAAVANEQRVSLLTALDRLREDDRQVLAYRYLFDLSEAEMAEALGCSRGTVKSRLSRSLGRLRDDLKRVAPLLMVTPDMGDYVARHLPAAVVPAHAAAAHTFAAAILQRLTATATAAASGATGSGATGSGSGGAPNGAASGGSSGASSSGTGIAGGLSVPQVVAAAMVGVVVVALAAAGLLLSTSGAGGPSAQATSVPLAQTVAPTQAAAPAASSPASPVATAQVLVSPSPAPTVVVVYGDELTDAQRQELGGVFTTSGPVATETVSHQELVTALLTAGLTVDGSERATSSVEVACLEPGAGLQVRTENISQLPAAAYANALVSAGIADASVTVAAPPSTPLTGETALVGVLKAYPACHAGQQPEPGRLRLAYDQLRATASLAESSGAWDRAAAVMLRASQAAITPSKHDDAALSAALDAAAAAEGLELGPVARAQTMAVLQQLAAVEHGPYGQGYALQQVAANEVHVAALGAAR